MRVYFFLAVITWLGTAPTFAQAMSPPAPMEGIASWYSEKDRYIRRKTASGEIFKDTYATCASWHYPFGTWVKITNLRNGKSVTCRVNDRGPKRSLNRVIDLTKSSFRLIAHPKQGLVRVKVTPLQPRKLVPPPKPIPQKPAVIHRQPRRAPQTAPGFGWLDITGALASSAVWLRRQYYFRSALRSAQPAKLPFSRLTWLR